MYFHFVKLVTGDYFSPSGTDFEVVAYLVKLEYISSGGLWETCTKDLCIVLTSVDLLECSTGF